MKKETIAKQGPCNDCPWRKDAPSGYWHPDHFHQIARDCRGDGLHTMLCHKSTQSPTTSFVCAGWVAAQGTESIGVRLLMMQGTIDPDTDYSGGHELHTFDEMLEANDIHIKNENPYERNIRDLQGLIDRSQTA